LSFDFALSFNTRKNYIHSWFYYDNVKHCAISLNYIKNLFQNNRVNVNSFLSWRKRVNHTAINSVGLSLTDCLQTVQQVSIGKFLLSQWAKVKVRQWPKVLQWLDLLVLKHRLKTA